MSQETTTPISGTTLNDLRLTEKFSEFTYRTTEEGLLDVNVVKRDNISEVEANNDWYWRSTKKLLFLDYNNNTSLEALNNWRRSVKEALTTNTIGDKDKVFFTKSSLFPRSSFNRYSDKARLVQVTKAATKFVVTRRCIDQLYSRDVEAFRGAYIDENGVDQHDLILGSADACARRLMNTRNLTPAQQKVINGNSSRYNLSSTGRKAAITYMKEIAEATNSRKYNTFRQVKYKYLVVDKLTDQQSMETLLNTPWTIDQLVSDDAVNAYIDNFKDELDESTYDYLVATLGANKAEPEVPMQLLTNMSIPVGNPRLDALFLNLSRSAIFNIMEHRVMKTVDVKNFVKQHGLMQILEPHQADNLQGKLNTLSRRLRAYTTEADRRLFFDLVEDKLTQMINEHITIPDGTIKLKYEALND